MSIAVANGNFEAPRTSDECQHRTLVDLGILLINSIDFSIRALNKNLVSPYGRDLRVDDGCDQVAEAIAMHDVALDVATGQVKWVNMLTKRAEASPIIAGDSVLVATADGSIIRYELATGRELWSYEVKGSFIGSPAVADGKLVLASDRGTIYCFGKK